MHNRKSEIAKDFKGTITKLIKYDKILVRLLIVSLILSFASSVLTIVGPDKLKDITNVITNNFMTGIPMDEIKSIATLLIIIYSLSAIFGYLEGFIMNEVTAHFQKRMRNDISKKINLLPLSYFDKTTVGDILSRVTNDVDNIGFTMTQSLSSIVGASTLLVGSLIMMFYTNWILAITAILSTIIGLIFVVIIIVKSQKYFNEVQKSLGDINGHIEETFSGHNVVKVYNAEEEMNEKFDKINEHLFTCGRKSQFLSGLMHPLMGFTGNFGYVVVCVVGSILVINKTIDFGVIVAFMMYIRFFTRPLMQIAQSFTGIQSATAASERVFEFLEEQEMNNEKDLSDKLDITNVKGNLEFNNVHFGYNKDKEIIHGFTAKAKSGEKIAIVGPTGAGKTTIVNLLMKFYPINSGDIIIDGHSINDLTRENIHDLFTMVLQDTWIFEGTIKDNIRYNNKNVTDEEIEEACKKVGLHHLIKTLPKGYDTILTDAGNLSAGEKQLLTITRAMISKKPYLILDEATSNVDTRTEELVQSAMDKLAIGKTSFIIAHRLSTIRNADLILVMNNGKIIEQGTHEELLKKNGFYADLYNSQFQELLD
jgi:ATP-binding cassette subfamily B protein